MSEPWRRSEERCERAEEAARQEFKPPASIEDAGKEIAAVQAEILDLEKALRRHRAEVNEDFTSPAARTWRADAKYAITRKVAKLRLLKEWVRDEKTRVRAGLIDGEPLDPRDPRSLCRAAFVQMREWARSRAVVRPEEWAVLNALENFVTKK